MRSESRGLRYTGIKTAALICVIAMLFAALSVNTLISGSARNTAAKIIKNERFNMSYIYFGSTASYTGFVDNTGGSLDHIAPSYFDLNKDGTLKLTGAIDRNFIDAMHKRGIKVTPFLSNHWDRESGVNALNKPEILASQIADAIVKYNLDGVDVDIENMTETERDKYTEFVRILRNKLPLVKTVSVAVAPNPYKLKKGWHASYDFAALQKYADYLMLMTYDQHYQGYVSITGGAGPVAGYDFVEKSIKAALKEVPAEKLVLGIPFYGRLWKQGALYGGYGISNNTVEAWIKEFKGKVVFDKVQKSPKAVLTIKPSDRKPAVFGVTLEAGTYEIWYENEASIKSKLELVQKYNLKGTGSWSLGQETKDTWDYYSLWLNGIYFSDIQDHWAKESILSAMDNGWMEGVSASRFEPESPMTRAQAAVLLVRVLGISGQAASGRPVFTDISGHWAQEEIETAAKAGILKGVGSSKFEPDKVLTREQMAVVLDRLLLDGQNSTQDYRNSNGTADEKDGNANPVEFKDTDKFAAWSYEAIARMTAAGFIEGYPDGTFRPVEAIKRGQMAVLITRTAPALNGAGN